MPPFRDHAKEIMVRTLDVDGSNSLDLVRIIHRDVGLAARLLRVANSVMYNHSERPILSIAHATTLLGWLEVRDMANTDRWFDRALPAARSPGLRELLLASLLTAVPKARRSRPLARYPRPEEAYICGLFRQY